MNRLQPEAELETEPASLCKLLRSAANHFGYGIFTFSILSLAFLGTACSSQQQQSSTQSSPQTAAAQPAATPAATAAPQSPQEQANQIFTERCSLCHGAEGRGDGSGGAGLDPKPRNFHDQAWQKATTDAEIEKAIIQGGASVGKSPLMVPNPDLKDKPEVVAALRERVRNFGKEK